MFPVTKISQLASCRKAMKRERLVYPGPWVLGSYYTTLSSCGRNKYSSSRKKSKHRVYIVPNSLKVFLFESLSFLHNRDKESIISNERNICNTTYIVLLAHSSRMPTPCSCRSATGRGRAGPATCQVEAAGEAGCLMAWPKEVPWAKSGLRFCPIWFQLISKCFVQQQLFHIQRIVFMFPPKAPQLLLFFTCSVLMSILSAITAVGANNCTRRVLCSGDRSRNCDWVSRLFRNWNKLSSATMIRNCEY